VTPVGVLGDGGTPDVEVSTFLLLAAFGVGWASFQRLRGRSFARLPRGGAWTLAGLATACAVLAFVLPPLISPGPSATRPTSTATIRIVSPSAGEVFTASPSGTANVPVRLTLVGGRIVPFSTTRIRSNEGHIHLFLDGVLVSMTGALTSTLTVAPGPHVLRAEFVAADHGPFDPRVLASVRFTVRG